MVSLQFHSVFCKNSQFSSINKLLWRKPDRCSSSSGVVHAVEKDYEFDPEKAREALQKLDQQLQELSQKQVSAPKTKALDVKLTRDDQTVDDDEEEMKDMSGSTFALITGAFFLFTIFYNVFYITVIDRPR